MNASDVIKYGHSFFTAALEQVPRDEWQQTGVCGIWSVKDVVAHLAACEVFLGELLAAWSAGTQADFGAAMGEAYSPAAVEARAADTPAQVLAEYDRAYQRVSQLIGAVDAETLGRARHAAVVRRRIRARRFYRV